MNKIQSLIIGTKEITVKRNFIWNMLGSGVYSIISMLLSVLVIRIVGENDGGIFSIAITVSQMMLYIAYFEQRTYQVTDVERKYTFSQYHGAKIVVCGLMLLCSALYIFIIKRYPAEKADIIFLMCVYRMIDGYADLYEGQFQLEERIYLAGKSMAFRSVISSFVLICVMCMTKNMQLSLYAAILAAVIGLIIFDIGIEKLNGNVIPEFDFYKIFKILKDCFPLFIGCFLWVYILSASRIAVDANLSNSDTAYYQVLFLPVSIINLFGTFFFRPELTTLSDLYDKVELTKFVSKIRVLLLMMSGFTVLTMIGAYLLGIPVLSLMSSCNLSDYKMALVVLMLAGGINAASFFLYYILTIMRKSGQILLGYISSAVIAFAFSNLLSRELKINGAALSFLLAVIVLFFIFSFCFLNNLKNDRNRVCEENAEED